MAERRRCQICPTPASHRVLVSTQKGEAQATGPLCLPDAQAAARMIWDDPDFLTIEVRSEAQFEKMLA